MVNVMHGSVILLFNVHNVSKFDRVTNRITERAKRERKPSRVPVKILMKAQKKRKKSHEVLKSICQITFFNNVDHRSNALFN